MAKQLFKAYLKIMDARAENRILFIRKSRVVCSKTVVKLLPFHFTAKLLKCTALFPLCVNESLHLLFKTIVAFFGHC